MKGIIIFVIGSFLLAMPVNSEAVVLHVEKSIVQPDSVSFVSGGIYPSTSYEMWIEESYPGERFVYPDGIFIYSKEVILDGNSDNLSQVMAPPEVVKEVFFTSGGVKFGKSVPLVLEPIDGSWRARVALDIPFVLEWDVVQTFGTNIVASDVDFTPHIGTVLSLPMIGVHVDTNIVTGFVWPEYWTSGAVHTVNNEYSIGIATMIRGSNQSPGNVQVGSTNSQFFLSLIPSLKNARFYGMIFGQMGTALSTDLENIMMHAGGRAHDVYVLPDGRYWAPSMMGIDITAGESLDIYISYQIVSGVGKTVIFEVWDAADVLVYELNQFSSGPEEGYQLLVDGDVGFSVSNPWVRSERVTIIEKKPAPIPVVLSPGIIHLLLRKK